MRLTIVNQFYRPDVAPTAQLAASLAEHRAALGDDVTVITSKGRYVIGPAPRETPRDTAAAGEIARDETVPPPAETHDPRRETRPARPVPRAPCVLRVWTPSLGKSTVPKRLLDYLSFYLGTLRRLALLRRQDVIVSMTTPPYIALAALAHKLLHPRTKLVLWNMDCYPDAAERAGMLRRGGLPSRILRALNRFLFRRVDLLVGLDTAMIDLLTSQYSPSPTHPPAEIVPNWEDLAFFPRDVQSPPWPEAESLGLTDKFVVLYLGNAGTGHAFETALDAAERLRGEPVVFLFVGGGSRSASIREAKEQRHLDNVLLREYVPKELTPSVMKAAGCALITLRDEALGVMSPSKLHSNLAMGLPVLYIGPERSNVDDALRRFACGVSLRHGDVTGAVAFIRTLASDPAARQTMRQRARAAFEQAYCDVRTLPQFDRLLDTLRNPTLQTAPARRETPAEPRTTTAAP